MPDKTTTSKSSITVCSLWENDYHKGLGTLVNSLVRVGYRGRVWAGYRGALPAWAATGEVAGNICTVETPEGIEVKLCKLETDIHMAQYKAAWMEQVLTEHEPEAEGIFYFDSDIFVLGEWSFFERWVRCGVAVCEDQSYPVNPTHPLVREWQQYTARLGYEQWTPPQVYVNSGLLGVTRETQSFLTTWQELIDAMQRDFGLAGVMKTGTRVDMFHQTDQDALVVAMAITSQPISWVGIDGMAFGRGEWLTLHAISKPWRRRVFRDWLVEGHRPDASLRMYWQLAGSPVPVETSGRIRRHRFYLPLAAMLSRFYKRV
ncbi:MAG TPA: hypothetical protein VGN16_19085 [Acidobacteriaceae bacterium]|jgi:hypothetical protein